MNAVRPADADVPAPQMSITRFRAPGLDLRGLGEALARWYVAQGLQSDSGDVPGGVLVRCRRDGGRSLIGTSLGLTVVLRQDGLDLAVEVGAGKWSDKAWVAGAGVLLASSGIGLIPLATSAVGAWRQWRLPAQTIDFLRATAPSFSGVRAGDLMSAPSEPAPSSRTSMASTTLLGSPSATPPPRSAPAGPLDVNTAGPDALAAVPGLDRTVASRLVDERNRLGSFRTWDQVRDVLARSLPPHRLAQARPWLTVGSSRTQDRPSSTGGRGPLDL
jgi:hypothetical protein